MPITSYAQNFEDVLLWRALQHVSGGFYVDIGAQDPVFDSVSKGFYERGWRGVHVEPTVHYAELLRRDRPDEIVVHAAASDRAGMLKFYEFPDSGLSTGSPKVAETHRHRGWKAIETLVTTVTLDQVFANIDSEDIHWLKIDVEGFEHPVLKGWRRSSYRPWIVVVEAMDPLTLTENYKEWEPLLISKGYSFAYFDGLNRYYVSAAHKKLKKHFRYGPSLWDEFQLPDISRSAHAVIVRHKEALDRVRAETEAKVAQQSDAVAQAQTNIVELNNALSEARGALGQAQSELDQARGELDQTRSAFDQIRSELSQTHDALTQTHGTIETTRSELEQIQSRLGQTAADLDQARQAFDQKRDELDRAEGELSQTRGELNRVRGELDQMRGELHRTRSDFSQARGVMDQTRNELEQARRELDQTLGAMDRAMDELDQTRDALGQTRGDLHEARNELDQKQDALDHMGAEMRRSAEGWSRQRAHLAAEIEAVTGSLWWRISVPFRKPPATLAVLAAEIMANRELGAGKERPPVAGSLDELLNRDGETFVRCAYATLLGREADSKGLRYFLGQLLLGSSREAIAAELSASREGRQFGARLPGLDGLVRRHHLLKTPIVGPFLRLLGVKRESRRAFPFLPLATITGEGAARIASSAAELLSLHDEAFVQSAYATLLGHDPDPDDLRGYLTRVRDGDSRHAILAEIRLSPEGQKRKNTLLGLNRVIRPYRWRRLPLLGPILRWVRANPERMDVPRKLASIETKLHLLSRLAPPAGVAERQDKPRPDSVPLRNSPPADAGSVARATSEDVSAKHGPEAVIWSSPLTWRIKEVCRETKQRTPIALEMERALAELGHDVRSAALNGAVDITALFASPPLPANASDRSTLLVGHDWEEGGYPAEWADQFNAGLGGVASASTHAMKVLIDHGVDVPLAAVGMGVDHWERISAALDYRAPGKTFRFLHFSSCTPDKAADLLLESFARVFDSDDDVSLIVKSSDEPPHELFALRERLLKANPRLPDIILIEDKMTDARLKALYGQCNVFVAPSRAEGFGLPIAQALLCGLPAVATAWGGHLDYCDETNSWLVDYRFQSAKTANDLIVSVWAEPLAHSLDESLWTAYRASPAERFAKSWSGRKRLLERGTWKDAALRLAALAQRAKAEVAVEPKKSRIGWITTWNVKCGIATHSAHLLASIPTDEFIVFAARQEPRIKSDEPNCLRSWNPGKDVNGLDEIAHKLLARSVDALVIQFNYGFFNHFELNEFIESVVAKGIVVVIDLHSTIDPHGERQNFRLTDFLSALRKCHRILAHGLEDMNRLKALGLVDNVMLFPHGVVKKGQDPTVPAKHYATPLVSSFGFCLPNKGLLELVHAVYLLKREGRSVRLRMLNAEHPTPESVAEVQRIKETIQRLDLQDSVEMHSEFLEEDVCLTLLGEADLVVNPYQLTGESASGSVRYGLAARRPVAVTPLPIFNDLGDAVFRMPGTTPREIAEGITSALRNIEEETETAKRVRFAARRWLDAHDYSLQAIRLMRMARALARREVLIGIANGEGS